MRGNVPGVKSVLFDHPGRNATLNARSWRWLYLLGLPLAAFSALLTPAAGCSDDGSGGSGGGCEELGADKCFDYACFEAPSAEVSFSAEVLPIFEQSCSLSSACHGNPQSPVGPDGYKPYLGEVNPETTPSDIDLIFSTIVGADSFLAPTRKLVDPEKPETSFLMNKMDGDLSCSALECNDGDCLQPMPQGSGVLDRATRDVVRTWILQGAKNN